MPLEIQHKPLDSLIVNSEFAKDRFNQKHKIIRPHRGIDLQARTPLPVYNAHNGKVIFVDEDNSTFGKVIVIQDPVTKESTLYAHLSRIDVAVDDEFNKRTPIGMTGATGGVPPHLHLEVIDETVSEVIRTEHRVTGSDIRGKGRLNPRLYFERSEFASEFPVTVDADDDVFDITGGDLDNQMIGNDRLNPMEGGSGFDTYTVGPRDTIEDVDDDGRIFVEIVRGSKKERIEVIGEATIIKDENGDLIQDRWILRSSGFELGRVVNADGSVDLRITKGGVNPLTADPSKVITIKNFPEINRNVLSCEAML